MKNESAFPHENVLSHRGMTLRDYFAAKAMQGILASWAKETCMYEEVSAISYEMADEMLKAREHGNS
jgi:hypothetical protein